MMLIDLSSHGSCDLMHHWLVSDGVSPVSGAWIIVLPSSRYSKRVSRRSDSEPENPMDKAIEAEIRELLLLGDKISAIKRYREATGVGLAEAKTAVEFMESVGSIPERVQPESAELIPQIVDLLGRGEKILAVKLHREQTGSGLKEAKDAVERIGEQHGVPASSGNGCLGIVLLGIAVIGGLLY
jgi:ribosomal protein L7/L12